jgi:hypothetical protein
MPQLREDSEIAMWRGRKEQFGCIRRERFANSL